jgi:hypothetical protein
MGQLSGTCGAGRPGIRLPMTWRLSGHRMPSPENRRAGRVLGHLTRPDRSPCLSPCRCQPCMPARDNLLGRSRMRSAVTHGFKLFVVTGPAGRDDRQSPGMQQLLQPPVAGWIARRVHGVPVLPEKLFPLLLRQVPENNLRIIWVLWLNLLGGHSSKLHRSSDTGLRQRGQRTCRGTALQDLLRGRTRTERCRLAAMGRGGNWSERRGRNVAGTASGPAAMTE